MVAAVRLAALVLAVGAGAGVPLAEEARAGEPGGPGLVLAAGKVLVCALEGPQVIDRGAVVVRDGLVEWVGPRAELEARPTDELLDVSPDWLMPGLVDLHSHVASAGDINDAVYQANPGLRASSAILPGSPRLLRGLAGGVTTVLHIPGSATNVGGQGILLKTGLDRFEDMRVRDPGSLKVAQADNPKGWGFGMNRIFLNWQIRETFRRGMAYARRWRAYERGEGEAPARDLQFDVFRALESKEAQVSAHTQVHQVVLASIAIMRVEFGVELFIDHGTFDGFRAAEVADRERVPAILGPRALSTRSRGRRIDHDGRFEGVAAQYQARGHWRIGFNTDAPVVPQEDLPLQAAMGARYGFTDENLETVRGLTIVPAVTAGIDHRVGSLEPGKDADLVVVTGHPVDPRSRVRAVWIEGQRVYTEGRGEWY